MTERLTGARAFALLTDGTQIEIGPLGPADLDAVRELHEGLCAESLYLRFFGLSRAMAGEAARRVCRGVGAGHAALGAWLRGDLIAVAEYEPTGVPGEAEVAMAVADRMHRRGVGTLLLEHLGSLARAEGIVAFRAETLPDNSAVLRVLADAGMPTWQRVRGDVVELTVSLVSGDGYLDAVVERERRADVPSLEPLLRSRSVVVIGASRERGTAGAELLHNLVAGGFKGAVYAVNPHCAGGDLHGAPCAATLADLPEVPDLAIITVPAQSVPGAAAACGRFGIGALLVIRP